MKRKVEGHSLKIKMELGIQNQTTTHTLILRWIMELFPILFWNKLYIIAKLRKSKVKPNSGSYGCLKSNEKNGYCFWIKKKCNLWIWNKFKIIPILNSSSTKLRKPTYQVKIHFKLGLISNLPTTTSMLRLFHLKNCIFGASLT